MLERLAAWFLNTYVAEYVGNLNTDQLSIGLLTGAVELEKLTLKKDTLQKLKLPVEVKAGYLGKLRLQVPVRYIKSQPWVLQIDQLYLIAGLPDVNKFDPEEERDAAQKRKKAKLVSMEQKWREEQQGKSSWFWSSFASSFTSTIAENLQVTINNIHIRYEDPEVGGARNPLVIGMIIEQLTAQSTDENWELAQFTTGSDQGFKLVSLCNLNLYWDSELLSNQEGQEFMEAMYHKSLSVTATQNMMSSSYFAGSTPLTKHLILPTSAQGRITLNRSPNPLKIADGPRVNVDLQINDVPIILSESQFNQLVKLSDAFKLRMISQKYHHLRPKDTIKKNPKCWWKFAMTCITQDIKEVHKRLSVSFMLQRARQCVDYVTAYTDHLTQSTVSQESKDILDYTESELNYEEVVILRRVVMQRIEKERALIEEAKKVAREEASKQSWFPGGWWSTNTDSSTTDAINSSTEEKKEIDEEELLDELGLEMDGNSKLLRDRIFAQISFRLTKGSLQLVTDEEEESGNKEMGVVLGSRPLLEIELSSLLCHCDYRPRLKYGCVEVQLGGVSIYDHYQDESMFTTLVEPKNSISSLRYQSIKFSRTSSCGEIFQLQFIQQENLSIRSHTLSLVTRPLDVVYNKDTINRIKQFFTTQREHTNSIESLQAVSKIAGLVGGVDHSLLDHLTVKLDISAPHVIIPKDFNDKNTQMVVIDLGHLTFESISDWPEPTAILKEEEFREETDEPTMLGEMDIDDDDEFVTPPSTPPPQNEAQPVSPTELSSALNKPHLLNIKTSKIKGYMLQLSEIQVLVGEYGHVQTALSSGRSLLHLLDQFSLLVQIERQKPDSAQINIMADLPQLHFHLDEEKVHTLLSCFLSPSPLSSLPPQFPSSHSLTTDQSMYMSFGQPSSISMYESAVNFLDPLSHAGHVTHGDVTNNDATPTTGGSRPITRNLSAEISELKLIKVQININELMLDLNTNKSPLVQLKVSGMRAGLLKRLYDLSGRLIIEDICVVDKIQEHGPQYELIVCSSGEKLLPPNYYTDTPHQQYHNVKGMEEDIFTSSLPFLVNVSVLNLSCLSPDHPSVMVPEQGGTYTAFTNEKTIRKLTLQCTAVDLLANQKTIVELISLSKKAIPSHLFTSTNKAMPTIEDTPTLQTVAMTANPTQTEISLELEKLSIRTLRSECGLDKSDSTPSLLTASFEFFGLGIQTSFGMEINIDGYMEGVKITDLTPTGKLHPNIVSLGACREGRDSDMITTMMTSYDSLRKMADVVHFSINRIHRPMPTHDTSHTPLSWKRQLFDLRLSAHIPSILYCHSVNFVQEMETFATDFLQYFDSISNSMKTAALGVAKGLVREKSKLADRLNQLSTSFGGRYVSFDEEEDEKREERDDTDMGGVIEGEGVAIDDRVLINILIKSPVVVIPSSGSSQNSLVAHLGEISIENCFIDDMDQETMNGGCGSDDVILSSKQVDRLTINVSNVTLHSSHDPASRSWLISEIQDESPAVSGRWHKILNETSFLLQIERALGKEGCGQTTPLLEDPSVGVVDVKVHCVCSSSIFVSLPHSVFNQIKVTLKHGLYQPPINRSSTKDMSHITVITSPDSSNSNSAITDNEGLPKIYCSFSLTRLSIELKHLIGSDVKDIVFISFDDFIASCRKTTPYHTHFDLGLKSVVIEDLLQNNETYRYILSSTLKPLPFSSPVSTPSSSLYANTGASMGISPRTLLPLIKLISSPRPPKVTYSPLRSFNPFSTETTPTPVELTTPPADNSSSSLITDIQDVVSIRGSFVSEDCPNFQSKYNSTSINADVTFSTVYLIVNLQTWVLLFDYLGIGVPTPPPSPPPSPPHSYKPLFDLSSPLKDLDRYSLGTDGSIFIKPEKSETKVVTHEAASLGKSSEYRSTVWGAEGKLSAQVSLKVQSLTVTFNKPEHPLAKGTASELSAQVNLSQSNVRLKGSLGQGTIIDLTSTGAYYRERLTTSGDQALSFDIFKFGRKDPGLERPYDISASIQLSAVRYLHTMRFLKEIIAFCQHFPQLIDAFQRMKAASKGYLSYAPDRKPRILLEIEADGPMILIPKHAFSPELMGGAIKRLTVHNKFLYDGEKGTLSFMNETPLFRVQSTPGSLFSFDNNSGLRRAYSSHDYSSHRSKAEEDKEVIEDMLLHQGPCLLDCIELVLSEVDVFSARKTGTSLQDGYNYKIERDQGQLLKERGTLKLAIERNLYEDFCRSVPDIHITGTLLAVHLMLDKRQLEIIKGLVDMNLGEQIDEFEKPSSVIHDPVAQPIVVAVWTGFRFHIKFMEVQLEFLQSRATPTSPGSLTQSLALFDIQLSQFTFESHSDQSKTVDFTTHAVIVHDTRYEGYNPADKPNVFEEVLKPRNHEATPSKSFQVELHVSMSPSAIKASILLNRLRLIGVVNLLMELKQFVIDKLPEENINEGNSGSSLDDIDGEDIQYSLKNTLQQAHKIPNKEEKKTDRDVKVSLSITETDLVVVEDLSSLTSNAVVMKGTVVLKFHSPPVVKGPSTLHCSIDGLELFSCCVSHEDDTALSILDPMSIGIELKPLSEPNNNGTHLLEFDIRQLNVRLSYNDIKLFVAILQNLQLSAAATGSNRREGDNQQINTVNEVLVKKLLPLGFTRAAILKELNKSEGDINTVALQLMEEERKAAEKKNNNKLKLKSLEVIMGSLNIYLIDDSLNHDVPLFELSLSSLQVTNQMAAGLEGHSMTTLSLDYYNRNISAWEPILEPWKVQLLWKKICHFSTDLDTNEKPDRITFSLTSPDQLNINVTSSLLLLLKDTQASWSSDMKMTNNGTNQKSKEKQLLKIHRRTSSRDDRSVGGVEDTPSSNVQQSLALLHSVRFISQSRQRTKFIPFCLRNSTGLPLCFATLTSLPSHVLFNPSVLLQSPRTQGGESSMTTPTKWIEVAPGEEIPFDFISRQKIRHKDTKSFVIHQLRVKVSGWEEINIPISVDKIGIFFRDIHQSDGRSQVRLYFAVSLNDTRKCVNVRSGLVIHNTLELPMEVKLDPPNDRSGSIDLPVISPGSFAAVPLHLTDWSIRVRPQGWGLMFCSRPLLWDHVTSSTPTSDLRMCETIGDMKRPLFRFCIEVCQNFTSSLQSSSVSNSSGIIPAHTISLRPVFTVSNLLPYGFHLCYHSKEKYIPQGKEIPIHNINSLRPVVFSISKLESFEFSEDCHVSIEEVGVVKSLVVRDRSHCPLHLCVSTELVAKGALKVSIWCPYWLINRTGLPLVFASQGDPYNSGTRAAGQFEEHEMASNISPLLFAYSEDDLLQKCQVRLGRGQEEEGIPNWSSGFRMLREGGVMRLFVRRGQGRPDREYQIGMEIQKGSGRYQVTRLVTFVARFQLENKTSFKLAYLQRHLLPPKGSLTQVTKDSPVILPGSVMAFHWPRADLDQLLCIKVSDLTDSYWSGGFPLEQDKSFHINMRCSFGRSVFIRCEVIQRGATYHVIFSDASDYPLPFKLENLSQISVQCYQQSVTDQHQYTILNPGQSVPYSWDEVTLPEVLCLHVKEVSEPRPFDLSNFGPQGKVYYENYFYIVAMETKTDQSHLPESQRLEGELVLDVPQGRAVILTRKGLERRSQLWRMTADGQLVHITSSSTSSGGNYVLDLTESLPEGRYYSNRPIPLIIAKFSTKRSSTQTWEFKNGRLVLSSHQYMCVQCRRGYESRMEGVDAFIGPVGSGEKEEFNRLKKSAGSGVLSVTILPDGPTRVLRITDESKKYTYSNIQDDWIIVEHGLTARAPGGVVEIDHTPNEGQVKDELSLSLSLEKGLCISLINSLPEELILATATGVRVEFVSTAVHQCVNATVQYIQVDNQMASGFHPIVLFPTPSPMMAGEVETHFPVINCFIERLPHTSPLAIVFRTVDVKITQFTVLLEERLLFRLLQWAGIGEGREGGGDTNEQELLLHNKHWSGPSSFPSRQFYTEQLRVSTTELLVSMHTTSQLPQDLQRIKKRLGFPLVQFESPIVLEGFYKSHMLGTPHIFMDAIAKHYKKVIQGQAMTILGSVDFLGNPMGLINDVASGIHGMMAANPDVVGLVRDVAHGMSDTTSKLTGTVSHVLGHATGDSSFQEEREQNLESCQTSGDHFKAGLINLTSGIFGGMTSILTQPYKGAVEEGVGGFIWGIGKGVVGTVAKPVAGLLDFASGTSAALRESMSRVSRHMPHPIRLRRCCVGVAGALTCYSVQFARGQEYLLRLNDGNTQEKLVAYEKFSTGSLVGEMRCIISSQCLYFFEESPPDLSSLEVCIKLDRLVECRATQAKTTIPAVFLVLSMRDKEDSGVVEGGSGGGSLINTKKYKCTNEPHARKLAQLINYAKNLHNEEKMIIRMPRLQNETIW